MKLLFIQSAAAHGSVNAQEGLDAVLMGSAFTECSLLFTGNGVLQLLANQAPEALGLKNFSLTFGALADYGVPGVYCRQSDLDRFGLSLNDLVIDVKPLTAEATRRLITDHDQVLNF